MFMLRIIRWGNVLYGLHGGIITYKLVRLFAAGDESEYVHNGCTNLESVVNAFHDEDIVYLR